jgi:hypothetical protein
MSSNSTGWMSSARTRRGAASNALTSPRRTNRLPPSLMLDSFPERAHAPIVSGRNLTFAAARISAASASVIQSAAAGMGRQSPPEPEEFEPDEPEEPEESERDPEDSERDPEDSERDPEEPEPEDREESEPDEPEPDADPSPDDEDDEDDEPDPSEPDEPEPSEPFEPPDPLVPEVELPRSFFAHPDPLKWMVGGANSFRIVPSLPHDGQNCGPGSLRPWRMSVRWSHAVQAYS